MQFGSNVLVQKATMAPQGLLAIFGALLYWRAMICLLASSALALVVASTFSWISVPQGFVIAFLGFIPGVVLEERAAAQAVKQPPQPTTPVVAGLSACLAGGVWGAASGVSVGSTISGACLLAAALGGWIWYSHTKTSADHQGCAIQCAVLAVCSYAVAVSVQFAL